MYGEAVKELNSGYTAPLYLHRQAWDGHIQGRCLSRSLACNVKKYGQSHR